MDSIDIAGHKVGSGFPCFIIAEAGVNHNGRIDMACQLVDVAVLAGADAIKFQTFKAERLVTLEAPKAEYQLQTTNSGESQYEMLRRLELSLEAHQEIMAYCQQKGILFMSTPFDEESANLLDDLGVAVFKIPSGEITNLPFLQHVASKGKPMIVSTGMSYLGEVESALYSIEQAAHQKLVLLHCVSNYPAEPADVNLRAMHTMSTVFGLPVGYSDHTLGIDVALAAVALGACVIEKHFTLDRNLPGPDHRASLESHELTAMIKGIRVVEAALGNGIKKPTVNEMPNRDIARRSLVAAQDIQAGILIKPEMITAKRPGTGLSPKYLSWVIGQRTRNMIKANDLIRMERLG